jgi:hypothetical protein
LLEQGRLHSHASGQAQAVPAYLFLMINDVLLQDLEQQLPPVKRRLLPDLHALVSLLRRQFSHIL